MTVTTIRSLYGNHNSKISDKWDSFFETYQRIVNEKSQSIESMLEIGVQNGGSLEIWAKLLPNVKKIIGCDIDPRCSALSYPDERIKILIGDATSSETVNLIRKHQKTFDLIIDDGSHQSLDIIRTFILLFRNVASGGTYVVEDLHCSYWSEFGGGLYFPFSAISFFKVLADIVSFQSWGIPLTRSERLTAFSEFLNVQISEVELSQIEGIEFAASMCVIRKKSNASVQVAMRIVSGHLALVDSEPQSIRSTPLDPPSQTRHFWSSNEHFSEGRFETHLWELPQRVAYLESVQAENAEKSQSISQMQSASDVLQSKNDALQIKSDALQSKIDALQSKSDSLQSDFNQVAVDRATLRSALALQQKITINANLTHSEAISELKTELARYVVQSQELKQQIHWLNSQREGDYLQAARMQAEIVALKQHNLDLLNSSSWQITKPLRFVRRLFTINRTPSAVYMQPQAAVQPNSLGIALNARTRLGNIYRFWLSNGTRELLKLVKRKISPAAVFGATELLVRPTSAEPSDLPIIRPKAKRAGISVEQIIAERHHHRLVPFGTYQIKGGQSTGRVTIITDSLNPNSLFGGAGTALILGGLLAEARSGSLRVLTRREKAKPGSIASVFEANSIVLTKDVEFLHYFGGSESRPVNIEPGEIFITTSWWTTAAAIDSVPAQSIVYLLQEDERMFYPFDDERLKCSMILTRPDINYVVNTSLLLDHFKAEGLVLDPKRWQSFEPAFPAREIPSESTRKGARKRLMFYARPKNERNLFHFGLEVIHAAIQTGRLNVSEWEIALVGSAIPDIDFGPEVKVDKYEGLSWADYLDLIQTIDLGLCLMYTPHPSYPPLDLIANGAVVLTNRFGLKDNLSHWSTDIVCADLTVESMLAAWDFALEKVATNQHSTRKENAARNTLSRSWNASLSGVVSQIKKGNEIV